jgi:TP901 family phage tail tape measure protein
VPDRRSRSYFENIVIGLNDLKKQLTLYQQQHQANLKLVSSAKREIAALKRKNAALRQSIASLKATERQTRATARSAQFMSITWEGVARVIVGSVVSRAIQELINAMTQAIDKTREFTIRIGEIRTISQDAQLSFATWAGSVRALSDQFGFPILDVAEATYETLSNQIAKGAETTIVMGEAARLARIGVGDLTDAVNALSSIINAYNLDASAARRISDELFVAIDLGRFRLEDIADSIGNVAILAAQLNISSTELLATLTGLTRQGVSVDAAMTLVRNVLINLIRPTDEMIEFFKSFGAETAEDALRAERLGGVITRLTKITDESLNPMSEFADIFGRIRGVIGAAGLTAFDYNKEVQLLTDSHEKATVAAKELANNLGIRLNIELERLKNIFTVDIGKSINNTLISLNETVGGFSNRLSDILNIAKNLVQVFNALVVTALVTSLIRALTTLHQMTVVYNTHLFLLGATNVQVTRLGLLYGIVRARVLSIVALLATWQAAIVAATVALSAFFIAQRKNRERLQRTIEDNITAEIIQYKLMTDEKIAEDLRHTEERISLALRASDLIISGIQREINALRANVNKQKELREVIKSIDALLFKEKISRKGLDPLDQAKILFKEANDSLNALGRNLDKLSPKEQATEFERIAGIIRQMEQLDGKRTRHAAFLQTANGKILTLGQDNLRTVVDTDKWAADLWRKWRGMAKNIRDAAEEQLKILEESQGTLESIEEQIGKLVELLRLEQKRRKEIEETGKAYQSALRTQKASVGEIKNLGEQLKNLLPEDTFFKFFTQPNLDAEKIQTLLIRDIQALIDKTKELEGLEIIPPGKIDELEGAFDAVLTRIAELETAGGNINQNITELTTKLAKQIDALKIAASDVEEIAPNFKAFEDAFKIISADLVTLQEATTAFQNVAIDNVSAITAAVTALNEALTSVITKLEDALGKKTKLGSYFGRPITRQAGGSIGKDSIPILASPGEFMMNARAARKFLPQLIAMNSGARRFDSGGSVVNNNIGDINVSIEGSGNEQIDARTLGTMLRRELRRQTLRLS